MLLSKIITFEREKKDVLESLGLKADWIHQIGLRALAAFNHATSYDAVSAPGSYAYFAAVRAKREILCPKGWEPVRQNNLEITKRSTDNMAIIVSSGDENTGIKDKVPKTKNPKGRQTKRVVYQNHVQLPLWENLETNSPKNIELGSTWILLYHIDPQKFELRMELSLPVKMDIDELRVSGWDKRIILSPVNFNNPSPIFSPEYDPEPEIKIIRRDDEN